MGDEDLELSELEEEEVSPPSTESDESDPVNAEEIEIPDNPEKCPRFGGGL